MIELCHVFLAICTFVCPFLTCTSIELFGPVAAPPTASPLTVQWLCVDAVTHRLEAKERFVTRLGRLLSPHSLLDLRQELVREWEAVWDIWIDLTLRRFHCRQRDRRNGIQMIFLYRNESGTW